MLPERKRLSHEIPGWVRDECRFFVTINCKQRGVDSLCCTGLAATLMASVAIYENLGKWYVPAFVVMPDHVHLIATFARQYGIGPTIRAWKGFHAKHSGIAWQSGFFEHRLRDDAEFTQKLDYVRMNPVRKGYVSDWKDWPHAIIHGDW